METKYRCDCPITSALDILGDKWMLVIVKQMLVEHKQTFKDFTESDEGIATNILTTKLKQLEKYGLVTKTKLPTNKKSVYYHLSDKALDLAPLIAELALWSDTHLRASHPNMAMHEGVELLRSDKPRFVNVLVERYRDRISKIPA